MQFDWQEVRRLLIVFVGDVKTEVTFLQPALQRIRETLADTEIYLLIQILPTLVRGKGKGEREREGKNNLFPSPNQGLGDLCNSYMAEEIRSLLPWVDRVFPYATSWQNPAREKELVEKLRQLAFDAAIIFTGTTESSYPLAYLCYLAGISIRVGQSREFGGGVLSHAIKPPLDDLSDRNPHLYLLDSAGFPTARQWPVLITNP
ncbi:hypothetical protein IQ238_05455 [Pleurocapsales cyanobacterium LEGE 06147]|nr:hypothetical protein [Pleurocapsales cyanobacterium LEGE 06147]